MAMNSCYLSIPLDLRFRSSAYHKFGSRIEDNGLQRSRPERKAQVWRANILGRQQRKHILYVGHMAKQFSALV